MPIPYPITVQSIAFAEDSVLRQQCLFGGKCGDLVAIRPIDEKYAGKTFLGILLGDMAISPGASWNAASATLTLSIGQHNPAIFIPEHNCVVFGYESWWGAIKDEAHLRQITNDDIQNVWYVKALRQMAETEAAKAPA